MCHMVRKHGNVKCGPSLPSAHLFTKLSEMLSTSQIAETRTALAMSVSRRTMPVLSKLGNSPTSTWRNARSRAPTDV